MQDQVRRIFSGSVWGILAKLLDALAKFITIPMLVGFYGKSDYGLIALAFSLNAYLRLMDLGFNVGAVRFFSMWTEKRQWDQIGDVSRSSMVFYGAIGLINALIFFGMAGFGHELFNLPDAQLPLFRQMMYILALSAVFNWLSNVIIQLLSAKDELGYVNRATVISSVLNFVVAFIAIRLQWPLITYFIFYTLSTLVPIPLYIYRLRVFPMPLLKLIRPQWNGKAFKVILNYSLAIFMMGIFQLTANNLRPLLLGRYATDIGVLTDYRVIQTIASLILAFGGVFMQVLLPSSSKVHAEGNPQKTARMIYEATKYISIFLGFIVFVLILNADSILLLYMGKSYENLSLWLILWLLTVLLHMHNTPVSSLVLSTGRTRFLVYSSGISCIVSLPITVIFAKKLQVGAAVVGYMVYMLMQIGFFYVYYIPKVLKLDSTAIFFRAFLPSALVGTAAWIGGHYLGNFLPIPAGFWGIVARSVIFSVIFAALLFIFVIKKADIHYLKEKLFRKGNAHG